jgi:hypothetical protein
MRKPVAMKYHKEVQGIEPPHTPAKRGRESALVH